MQRRGIHELSPVYGSRYPTAGYLCAQNTNNGASFLLVSETALMSRTREPQSRPPTQRRISAPGQLVSTMESGLPSAILAGMTQHVRPPILIEWCALTVVPYGDRPRICPNQRRREITGGKFITVPGRGDDYNSYKTETVITVIIIWPAACGVGLHASNAVLSYVDAAGARTSPGRTSRAMGEAQL